MRSVVLALLLAGCRVVYPGDGTLVLVDLRSPDVVMFTPKGARISRTDVARFGAHMWDRTRARLRLRDEVSAEEAAGAPSVPVFFSPSPWRADRTADEIGAYLDSGEVYVEMKGFDRPGDEPGWGWGQVVAHELGHAIGLEHVPDWNAIMYEAANTGLSGLSEADTREYRRVWGD